MKFSQIAEGQAFEYQGVIYTRHGPMTAVDKNGNSRLMPRSAAVRPVAGTTPAAPPARQRQITLAEAVGALDALYARLLDCLQDNATASGEIKLSKLRPCLEDARQACLKNLEAGSN